MIKLDQLQKIKTMLPHGSLKKIQKNSGVSYQTVIKFFKGKSKNDAVALAVVNEYDACMKIKQSLKNCTKGN
jgi:hypothetical protein